MHERVECVVTRALELLLLYLLLDEVVRVADGGMRARDGHDAVPGARGEGALLRDLDVGAGHLLDFHQTPSARAWKPERMAQLVRDNNMSTL